MLQKLYSKKTLTVASLLAMLLFFNIIAYTNTGGPSAGLTGAPSEGNCTNCHSGSTISSGSNWSNISLTHNSGNTEYIPDSTYTMTLTYTQSSITKYGFEITALSVTGNNPAGTLTATNSSVQKKTTTISGKTREYIQHTSGGTAASGNTITWTFSWKAPSSNVGDVRFYLALNATNSGSNTSGDQIYLKTFTFTYSSQLPRVKISAPKKVYCVGDSVTLTDTGVNVSAYKWQVTPTGGVSPADTSSSASPTFTFKKDGTFKFKVTGINSKGSSVDSVSILAVALPSATITPSTNQSICEGGSVSLRANTNGTKILWNTGDTTTTITVSKSGNYNFVATNSTGCQSKSADVTISVKPKPQVTLSSNSSVSQHCERDTVYLTATSGMDNYMFYKNGTLLSSGTQNVIYLTGAIGQATYKVIADSAGCSSDTSNGITHEFIAAPTAPSVFCSKTTNNSITFAWNAIQGATSYEYSTDNMGTWNTLSTSDTTYEWTGLGTNVTKTFYVRTINSGNICQTSAPGSSSCTTGSCLTTAYTFSGDTVVCAGSTENWSVTPLNTQKFALLVNGAPQAGSTFPITAYQNGNVSIEIVDSNQLSCPTTKFNVSVVVENLPSASLSASSNNVCEGDTVEFTANGTGVSYDFQDNQGNSLQKGTNTKFKTSSVSVLSGGIQLVITNAAQCDSVTGLNIVTVRPAPVASFTSTVGAVGYQYSFNNTSTNAIKTEWDFGDGKKDTGKSVNHSYTSNGSFTVTMKITGANGCTAISTKNISAGNVGVNQIYNHPFLVFPNPFEGQIQIRHLSGNEIISISSLDGKTMGSFQALGQQDLVIPTTQFPQGIYLMTITGDQGVSHHRIQKLHLK